MDIVRSVLGYLPPAVRETLPTFLSSLGCFVLAIRTLNVTQYSADDLIDLLDIHIPQAPWVSLDRLTSHSISIQLDASRF